MKQAQLTLTHLLLVIVTIMTSVVQHFGKLKCTYTVKQAYLNKQTEKNVNPPTAWTDCRRKLRQAS